MAVYHDIVRKGVCIIKTNHLRDKGTLPLQYKDMSTLVRFHAKRRHHCERAYL